MKAVKTPCIGVCSTGIGDRVCRGCKRFVHEIDNWNAFDNAQRSLVAARLESFLEQVMRSRLLIVDIAKLESVLRHQQIRFNPTANPYGWLFALLKAGASQIKDLADCGVVLLPGSQSLSLVEIRQAVDHEYYELSCAHYDRYFSLPV